MKKVSKKQKLIIKLVVIILIVIGFKPFLQQIEMWRSVDYLKKSYSDLDINWPTVYVMNNKEISSGDKPIALKTIDQALIDVKDKECFGRVAGQCFKKTDTDILSTQKDQNLIQKGFEEKKQYADGHIEFKDFNQDGIDDVFIQIDHTSSSDVLGNDYVVYSANHNKILWGFTKETTYNEFMPEPEINFINQKDRPPLIVIYDPGYDETTKSYSFYKVVDSRYQQVKPSRGDWRKYWKTVSVIEVANRIANTNLFLMALLIFGITTASFNLSANLRAPLILLFFASLILIYLFSIKKMQRKPTDNKEK